MRFHEFRAMNTNILLAAEGEPQRIVEGFQVVEEQVHQYEARFTRFADTSELSALNRSAGGWFHASPEMYEVVRQARHYNQVTNGLFNPGILQALENAGYDRSMDEIRAFGGAVPSVIKRPVNSDLFAQIRIDDRGYSIFLPAGLRIDLGGIAKGWIAERAARYLARYGRACLVDAGGDMFACGMPESAPGWLVAIEDPFDASRELGMLCVGPGAVATSAVTRRRWQQGDQERHHLINPRTGEPALAEWVSVSVVASHATEAEVMAKAVLIAGPGGAEELLRDNPDILMVAVGADGKLWGSEKSRKVLYECNAEAII